MAGSRSASKLSQKASGHASGAGSAGKTSKAHQEARHLPGTREQQARKAERRLNVEAASPGGQPTMWVPPPSIFEPSPPPSAHASATILRTTGKTKSEGKVTKRDDSSHRNQTPSNTRSKESAASKVSVSRTRSTSKK